MRLLFGADTDVKLTKNFWLRQIRVTVPPGIWQQLTLEIPRTGVLFELFIVAKEAAGLLPRADLQDVYVQLNANEFTIFDGSLSEIMDENEAAGIRYRRGAMLVLAGGIETAATTSVRLSLFSPPGRDVMWEVYGRYATGLAP